MVKNPNHPKKGDVIKVDPIRDLKAVGRIKKLLEDHDRNYALFVVGINSALRAGDLLGLKVGQVRHIKPGEVLTVREEKTEKLRMVVVNEAMAEAIWKLVTNSGKADDEFLFTGLRGQLTVQYLNRLVKEWCANVGLKGNFGSHTLRKTWGYHQRVTFKTDIPILMKAFGHSTQRQTLEYLGITEEEVHTAFMRSL